MNETLRDHRIYTESMAHSIWDKAFFMDKIDDTDTIIDFGCADGSMIHFLSGLFPEKRFYGFDIDPQMIALAKEKEEKPNVRFFGWDELIAMGQAIKDAGSKKVCLNLSSVLHEVFSFHRGMDDINTLLALLPVRFITIRDMYFHTDTPEPGVAFLRSNIDYNAMRQFEEAYGYFTGWKNITHFLMKYQWLNNGWEEEMKENYYSWNLQEFADSIVGLWNTVYENHYLLPHLCYQWEKQYGLFIPNVHTHAQFILKREAY